MVSHASVCFGLSSGLPLLLLSLVLWSRVMSLLMPTVAELIRSDRSMRSFDRGGVDCLVDRVAHRPLQERRSSHVRWT